MLLVTWEKTMMEVNSGGLVRHVFNEGFHNWYINTDDDVILDWTCQNNCQIFVHIESVKSIQFTLNCLKDSSTTLLIWNETKQSLQTNETIKCKKDSNLVLGYVECNQSDIERNTTILLQEEGSRCKVQTATLTNVKKKQEIRCEMLARNTHSLLETYGITLHGGHYFMNVISHIVNGASASSSHQVSKALTFDANQTSTILPQLLIDENDVEASHAASLGQIDEEQLFYLQSRGIEKQEVMAIISLGYLLPICELISEDELKEVYRTKMERLVRESCSM